MAAYCYYISMELPGSSSRICLCLYVRYVLKSQRYLNKSQRQTLSWTLALYHLDNLWLVGTTIYQILFLNPDFHSSAISPPRMDLITLSHAPSTSFAEVEANQDLGVHLVHFWSYTVIIGNFLIIFFPLWCKMGELLIHLQYLWAISLAFSWRFLIPLLSSTYHQCLSHCHIFYVFEMKTLQRVWTSEGFVKKIVQLWMLITKGFIRIAFWITWSRM